VAAALLFLGVAAGLANLDVRYNQDGLTVRTGWVKTVGAPAAAVRPAQDGAFGPPAPWRTDLAALEQQLRHEFHASEVSAASMPTTTRQAVSAPGMSDAELLRRVRLLIDESERRQQREIALRSAELLQDVKQQRYADMVKIDQSLGLVQSKTGMEVAKNRELLRYIVNASGQK
jgi:hypothetical protein